MGDPVYPLPETIDANGNKVYENSSSYKLLVNIAKTGGTYVFTGTGTDSAICVKKAATDPAERSKLAAEAEKVLMSTGGVNPIYFYTTPQMKKPSVHDVIRLAGGDVIWTYAYLD